MSAYVNEKEVTTTGIATSLVTVFELTGAFNADIIHLYIKNNDASVAITDFTLDIQAEKNGAYVTCKNATWTTADGNVLFASVDIDTLAANTAAYVKLKLDGVYGFRLQCKCGSTITSVTVRALYKGLAHTQGLPTV